MTHYYRPIAMADAARPEGAVTLAGGWCWFDRVEVLTRGAAPVVVSIDQVPTDVMQRLTAPRADIAGLTMDRPQIMGILNVTPDSFSDGGNYIAPESALTQGRRMAAEGATIIDVGGESTRPGAAFVPEVEEIARVGNVVRTLAADGAIVSIDTRKSAVARVAADAGAMILNDVAAMTFDPAMADVAARSGLPICLMHAQGDPKTMQDDPVYDDVLLDVYDFLTERVSAAVAAGIARDRIIVDPGIGFGKTLAHNLSLLSRLSLFHGLGCPILLGASRKRFIGVISGAQDAAERMPGSVAVAIDALRQGVQIIRVHDTLPTKQAFSLIQAINEGIHEP